jgi:hypothetical protein
MIKAEQIAEASEKVELVQTTKKDMLKPKQPLTFQLGSTEHGMCMQVTFNISDFDKDKDSKTLSVNIPTELAEHLNKFDQNLKVKANQISKQNKLEWRPLVVQAGDHDPRISVKIYCKESAPTRTRFYTWNGEEKNEDGKPVLEQTTYEHICAGQKVVKETFGHSRRVVELVSTLSTSLSWTLRKRIRTFRSIPIVSTWRQFVAAAYDCTPTGDHGALGATP